MSWLRYKLVDDYVVGIFEDGQEMMFDAEHLESISSHRWHIDQLGYPATSVQKKVTRLHRFLFGDEVPKGMVIDHINRNKLDNRRCNIRICTQAENVWNRAPGKNNRSGVSGVFFDKRAKRWRAQIYRKSKAIHVGIFDSYEDAVAAKEKADREVPRYV